MKHNRTVQILENTILTLKKIRLERKLSHETLAARAGISRPAVSHIESGKRRPTLLMALKLAHGLGIDLSSVIGEAERTVRKGK